MNTRRTLALIGTTLAFGASLVSCSSDSTDEQPGENVIAPVTMHIDDLSGAHVELVMDQILNINTDHTGETNYAVEIADPTVVEFFQGYTDGSAVFNPGFQPLGKGSTEVTMQEPDGESVTFDIEVKDL